MRGLHDYLLTALSSAEAPFEAADPARPLLFRKELIYPGHFVKKTESGDVEFELPCDEQTIDHWVATFEKMRENGIDVPLPVGHTSSPEANRGKVVKLTKEQNPARKDLGPSLYCYVEFRDDRAADLAKTTNVSLFSPPVQMDGHGNRYVRPIKHVALTDYPLIPGLAEFEPVDDRTRKALALSFDDFLCEDEPPETLTMTIAELADQMGVEYPEGADDATIGQAILDAWDAEPEGEETLEENTLPDEELLEEDPLLSADDTLPEEEPELAASLAPRVRSQFKRARSTEIDGLVTLKKITPAQARDLKSTFCTDKAVTYALSADTEDPFPGVVRALSLGSDQFATGSRTGHQQVSKDQDSSVVSDAKKRAERARATQNGRRH